MKRALLVAALALVAATQAAAQPTYKCWSRGTEFYTDVPCPGGRELDAPRKHASTHRVVPPQDRAKRANRARLTPENRRTCEALEVQLRDERAQLDKLPQPVSPTQEKPWVQGRLKYRQLHC